MALDDVAVVVSAVVALADDAFVAFDLLAEGMLATGEYQTHGELGAHLCPLRCE